MVCRAVTAPALESEHKGFLRGPRRIHYARPSCDQGTILWLPRPAPNTSDRAIHGVLCVMWSVEAGSKTDLIPQPSLQKVQTWIQDERRGDWAPRELWPANRWETHCGPGRGWLLHHPLEWLWQAHIQVHYYVTLYTTEVWHSGQTLPKKTDFHSNIYTNSHLFIPCLVIESTRISYT